MIRLREAEFSFRTTGAEHVRLPGGALTFTAGDSLSDASDPPASGGLLAALSSARLLVGGPDQFGSLNYFGAVPLADQPALAPARTWRDVLRAWSTC